MNDETIWAIYFANLCGIHFHPKNEVPAPRTLIKVCAELADHMMEQHHKRWPVETEETCQS